MGTVISFPESRRYDDCRASSVRNEPATIIILPVIRIERFEASDGLSDGPPTPSRKRRPPTRRS
jgi:hypothetical protein